MKALLVVVALATFSLAAFAQHRGGTLTVGLPYDIDTLNVYTTATLGDVESAVVEGLVAPDEHAHYVPVLATQVPTLSNGGIVLTRQRFGDAYYLPPAIRRPMA